MSGVTRRSFTANSVATGVLLANTQALAQDICAGPDTLSASDIRNILTERVADLSGGNDCIGMVAGTIGRRGRRIVSVGHRDTADTRTLTGDTAFEFGSVGKVFTAVLLADMVRRREVSLDDPVARHLAKTVKLPQRNGREITIGDLATHMSGLPFMPDMPAATGGTGYGAKDLYAFLAGYSLSRDIGSDWDYSNLGYWLLSEALAARANEDFKTLLRKRVLVPLRMAHSGFELSPAMKADRASGHDASLQRSPDLSEIPVYNLMPAAGAGFFSTANDALTFLAAAMGYKRSPLSEAIALTANSYRPIPGSTNRQGLGWTLIGEGSNRLVFRDGGTLGFASCLAWDPNRRMGTVVLANSVSDVSDIARHILRPDFQLTKPTPVASHKEIVLDTAILGRFVGRYDAPDAGTFVIALQGSYLSLQAPADWGLPNLRIRPESEHDFFASELPLRVTFQTGADGSATGMTVYPPRGQKGFAAQKVH